MPLSAPGARAPPPPTISGALARRGRKPKRSAERVNKLLGRSLARSLPLDAADPHTVAAWLRKERIQAFLSAVPYFFNLGLTEAAIQAGAGMTDLGGNSDVVLQKIARTQHAAP